MNASSPFTSAQGAIDAALSNLDACEYLATFWIAQGVCFTSGHVVHAIRSARPDLVFSQARMGAHLRTLFESGNLPEYDDGLTGSTPVVRVPRHTTSTSTRTPVGTEVFVYGPTADECNCFEFEINIAEAPHVADGLGGQMSAAAAMLGATPMTPAGAPGASPIPPVQPSGTVAVANGKMVPGNPFAVIHSDGRLCIPRIAFEALAFESGQPVKGGEPLYATVAGTKLVLGRSGQVEVKPTTDRLRAHILLEGSLAVVGAPFPVGKEFEIKVAATGLTIDLV
jgi:hypothetical protein